MKSFFSKANRSLFVSSFAVAFSITSVGAPVVAAPVLSDVSNGTFETDAAGSTTITNWTTMPQRIDLGVDSIAGCKTVDTTDYSQLGSEYPSKENDLQGNGYWNWASSALDFGYTATAQDHNDTYPDSSAFDYAFRFTAEVSDGATLPDIWDNHGNENNYQRQGNVAALTSYVGSENIRVPGYVIHGPAMFSDIFVAKKSDAVTFDWAVAQTGDDYHVFAYLLNTDNCQQTEIIDQTGQFSTWKTLTAGFPTDGNYRLVFVDGSYDGSWGGVAGAGFYVDNVTLGPENECVTEQLTGGDITAKETVVRISQVGTCAWTVPAHVKKVHALIIGGGGAGGSTCNGGGGGAGGVIDLPALQVSGTLHIGIGAGAPAPTGVGDCDQSYQAQNGGNTFIDDQIAWGGGGGGSYRVDVDGIPGGSGGGGGGVQGTGAAGFSGQGFAGSNGTSAVGNPAGGGGGATGPGGAASDGVGGAGGPGFTSTISGQSVTYAAGGGGASDISGGAGGSECAGKGSDGGGVAGNATGYGCGGGGANTEASTAGAGSNGVVILRYTSVTPVRLHTSFTGFAFEKSALTSKMKKQIKAKVNANPDATNVECIGYTGFNWNKRSVAFLKKLALARAKAVCAVAKAANPTLAVKATVFKATKSQSDSARRVVVKLTN